MATSTPHVALADVVVGEYCGWTEQTHAPLTRLEIATPIVPLIINFGDAYQLCDGHHPAADPLTRTSFVAGVYDTWVSVQATTHACALQVNFSPLGAWQVFQRPMSDLSCQTLGVDELFGREGTAFVEQLGNCAGWSERFARLDQFVRQRVEQSQLVAPPQVRHAWHLLNASAGQCRIGHLSEETGWSAKRLINEFRRCIGVPPKTVARLVRFQHLLAQMDATDGSTWATRALNAGYFDQSHLIHDFTAFAGCTPRAYVDARLPANGVVLLSA